MKHPSQAQQKVSTFFASEKVVVNHTRETFKAVIVNMVVNNAVSLRFFLTEGFKLLVGEAAEKLEEND